MTKSETWDNWLINEDSVNALAPEGYDEHAACMRTCALREQLISTFTTYEVRAASPELYQDSTGLAHFRITAKGESGVRSPTLAWILLSHFGNLATVKGCQDPELLTEICRVLGEIGLKYIPYEYLESKTYDGKCKSLAGFSWANRYFSLTPDLNYDDRSGG
jgi:hypothetical protein